MKKKAKVEVIQETESGLNKKVLVDGVEMTNNQAYKEAKKGNIEGFHGVDNHGTKYIRSNPDGNSKNNLD